MQPRASFYGRFFQLGYVVRDIDAASAALARRMGAAPIDIIRDLRDPAGNEVSLLHVGHMRVPGAEIELIQPRLDWPSIYLSALPERDEDVGFHHIAFAVADLAAWDNVVAQLDDMQTPIVLSGETPQVRFAYIDTRRQAGHYSELVLWFDPAIAR